MLVARILITGMSGTGKTTALEALGRRGHRVVDLDGPRWSVDVELPGGSAREQRWREEPVAALLDELRPGPVFLAGCASNQGRFRDRFDAVVLLSVPLDVLVDRLDSRTTNRFGKAPAERRRVLEDLRVVEPLLRATATDEIDATRPLGEVVAALEAVASRVAG